MSSHVSGLTNCTFVWYNVGMVVAFQYRLYPTKEQEVVLDNTLETCRHLYNGALAERIDAYQYEGRIIGYNEQQNQLPFLKETAEPLADLYSQVAQDCLRRLDKAYQAFFRRVKAGEKPGFPRFKGFGRYRSFCYPSWNGSVKIIGKVLRLSKIGDIAIRLHRPLPAERDCAGRPPAPPEGHRLQGTPKTCTISRKADGWYASIACEVEPEALPKTDMDVGIDVGIETFATFSDDHAPIANPRHLEKAQAGIRKAQKRLERRTRRDKNGKLTGKQSNRREKAKVLLAKAHLRVKRARLDFHHKTAYVLVRRFDTIYIENLNIRGMLKNHHLARVIADAGWGQFFLVLKSKAENAIKTVVEVCPKNTSQNCSGCSEYVAKALSCRTHTCPYCGLVLHRDKNAAENVRKNGRDAAIGERAVVNALREPRIRSPLL
jgi:putative transposase